MEVVLHGQAQTYSYYAYSLENAFYRVFKSLNVVNFLPSHIAFGQANF